MAIALMVLKVEVKGQGQKSKVEVKGRNAVDGSQIEDNSSFVRKRVHDSYRVRRASLSYHLPVVP